jgi:transcription initiation factor IIE alpha subunit
VSELPIEVADLPPSARQVYATLSTAGALTHRDLVRTTGMPARTVRYAVGRLREAGVIGARCNLHDCRQCYFFVSQQCPGKAGSNVVFAGIREIRLS